MLVGAKLNLLIYLGESTGWQLSLPSTKTVWQVPPLVVLRFHRIGFKCFLPSHRCSGALQVELGWLFPFPAARPLSSFLLFLFWWRDFCLPGPSCHPHSDSEQTLHADVVEAWHRGHPMTSYTIIKWPSLLSNPSFSPRVWRLYEARRWRDSLFLSCFLVTSSWTEMSCVIPLWLELSPGLQHRLSCMEQPQTQQTLPRRSNVSSVLLTG